MTRDLALSSRREFLGGALALCALWACGGRSDAQPSGDAPPAPRSATVAIESFATDGTSEGTAQLPRVAKSDAEWRAQLSSAAYRVTRHEGTERARTGEYARSHADGLYRCICCDTALFDSRTKFESGTGWPSFWQPISRTNVAETRDETFGMVRTAVSLRALRRAPRPRLRRRTAADRPALLHELRRAALRGARVKETEMPRPIPSRALASLRRAAAAALFAALAAPGCSLADAGERAAPIAAAAFDLPKAAGPTQTAVLSGGCFWGIEAVFEHVRGVRRVTSGYAGGAAETAQYEVVSGGDTGHAESVQIEFDPQQVSYGELLRIFFSVAHDPTQRDRQGPDVGSQYRSEIFYADDGQKDVATRYIAQLEAAKAFPRPIATRVDPLRGFYPAEAEHQDFIARHPSYPYVVVNDLPKLRNLERAFPDAYRESPAARSADSH